MRYLRTASIGILSGMLAGVAWGVGARVAMRLIAIADGNPPGFSIGGTLMILMVGAFFGIPLGLILVGMRRFVPVSGWRRGLIFGVLIMLALAYPFYIGPLQAEGSDRVLAISIGLFGALFIVYGMIVELGATQLERLMVTARPPATTVLAIGTLAVAGAFEVFVVLAMVSSGSQ